MTLSALPALALVLALGGAAQARPAAGQEPAGPSAEELASWRERVARDGRVAFAPLTGGAALEALEEPDLNAEERAVALFALGCSASIGERSQLANWAQRGAPRERRAAVLALGELGPGSTGLLVSLVETEAGELAQCALLALLRSGQADAVAFVEGLAGNVGAPQADVAAALLSFHRDPQSCGPTPAAEELLELRFAAARRFGLIDGKTWRVLLYEQLYDDEAFLDDLVFGSAPQVHLPGIKDYFLGAVLEDGSERALRAAVEAIPNELAQMAEAGLWVPRGDQWTVVLEEIEEQGVEVLCEPLLLQALTIEGLEGWAAFLLLRGGNLRGRSILERSLKDASPQTRRRVAEGLGATGDRTWVGWLGTFAEDADEEVRAAAIVGQARLGHKGAQTRLEILLVSDELSTGRVRRELLIEALARTRGDPMSLDLLEETLPMLVGRPRVTAATALAAAGRLAGAEVLHAQLRARMPRGAEGARLVRALGRFPTVKDIDLLRNAFPQEDDLELNVALAEVLLENKTPAVVALLRGAIWRPPLHRSLLAAALAVDALGIGVLRRELEGAVPRTARDQDLRRVGYALGFWGGLKQVEELSKRWGVGHPALQGAVLGALAARSL